MGHVRNYMLGEIVAHFRRRNGARRPAPDGLRRVRPAGGERRHPRGRPPARRDRAQHRVDPRADGAHGLGDRLGPRPRHARARVLPLDAMALPPLLRARPRLPQGGAGQVVPERPDRPRERAGDRRPLRALRRTRSRRKNLEQWFFRITDYADVLLDEMALLESWPERVLTMQRNWIGRSEGAELLFHSVELDEDIPVFTTRPDTIFGATFFVLAPEHPLVPALVAGSEQEAEVLEYVRHAGGPDRGRARGEGEGRRLHRPPRREPRDRRADADLGRRLRAHGVRHRRDHGRPRARRARLRLRGEVRPARAHGCRAGRRRRRPGRAGGRVHRALRERGARQLERLHRARRRRGQGADRPLARVRGPRPRQGRLPAARLAPLPPALLGLPDSRSSTAPSAGSSPCRTTSCPSCSPR